MTARNSTFHDQQDSGIEVRLIEATDGMTHFSLGFPGDKGMFYVEANLLFRASPEEVIKELRSALTKAEQTFEASPFYNKRRISGPGSA